VASTGAGSWAVLVEMNKVGTFLLNYFTAKIVKEFRRRSLVPM